MSLLLLITSVMLFLPVQAHALDGSGIPVTGPDAERIVLLFPERSLFPVPLADPHRAGFGVQIMTFSRTAVPDSGDQRYNLRAGGRFGLIRIHPRDQPDLGWQFSVEGGFDAQFDMDQDLDNIGWDGNYGLLLEHAPSPALAFRIAALHVSSHVGDEIAERIGHKRIGYTRHEMAATVSWRPTDPWRVYAEVARGFDLRILKNNMSQEPGRLQAGLEYTDHGSLWGGRMGWYAAADFQSWEERDWRLDYAFQSGLMFRTRGRDLRFGLEHVNGRVPIGEFFMYTERWTSFGVWIDW